MQRILVTGGAGFIGSNLVRQLQTDHPDARILIIDDMRVGTFANLSSEWNYRGNVLARPLGELDLFEELAGFGPDVIFHEASITDTTVDDEAKMIRDNVEPFEVLLEYAVETGCKLVWASSGATYGNDVKARPFQIKDAGRPANVYGFSKWVMENLHREVRAHEPDAHVVAVRYFNVFGPGEACKGKMASMIYQLAQQMLSGKPPRIFHDGDQARDHVYVQDVVEATIAGAGDRAQSGVYNVGTGETTTFNQIVASLNEALGTSCEPDYFDNPYPFYQDYTCADLTETQQGLNWSPRYATHDAIVEYGRCLAATRSGARSPSGRG